MSATSLSETDQLKQDVLATLEWLIANAGTQEMPFAHETALEVFQAKWGIE